MTDPMDRRIHDLQRQALDARASGDPKLAKELEQRVQNLKNADAPPSQGGLGGWLDRLFGIGK